LVRAARWADAVAALARSCAACDLSALLAAEALLRGDADLALGHLEILADAECARCPSKQRSRTATHLRLVR
jgi:hypothetical protein